MTQNEIGTGRLQRNGKGDNPEGSAPGDGHRDGGSRNRKELRETVMDMTMHSRGGARMTISCATIKTRPEYR